MPRGSSVHTGKWDEYFRGPGSRMRWAIVFCIGLWVVGCATTTILSETPMNTTCLEVPTVEECRTAAAVIENVCLRECVEAQCSGVKVVCDPNNQQRCKELNEGRKGKVGGFVTRKGQTCLKPKDEVAWCQLPLSRRAVRKRWFTNWPIPVGGATEMGAAFLERRGRCHASETVHHHCSFPLVVVGGLRWLPDSLGGA